MWSVMCGRSTYKLTWEEIVALYRLTLDQPARNTRARYDAGLELLKPAAEEICCSGGQYQCG
jgi:hypothetical protein